MKRFYKDAAVRRGEDGWQVTLDERPVRTPRKALLAVPSTALAEAIAGEWRAQGEEIAPDSMPLLKLANSMQDVVIPEKARVCAIVAGYGESDLLCYRADGPDALVQAQRETWDPLLAWLGRRYDVALATTSGIVPVAQSPQSRDAFARIVAALDPPSLAAGHEFVTLCGSLVIALALLEDEISPEAAWEAAHVDEEHQFRTWGEDEEARARLDNRRADLMTAYRFLTLARG